MKSRSYFKNVIGAKTIWRRIVLGAVFVGVASVSAETVYYSLDNVILDDDRQMTGIFSWTFTNDFEKGEGQFISLKIPWTTHDESDLSANIDVTESIEITLEGSVHDDGVDIMLVLLQPLTPTTSSLIDTNSAASKYEIGGNGFHTGYFISGSISPTKISLSITSDSPDLILSWDPELPGHVLQETSNLSSNWVDSVSGSTNPVVVPALSQAMFYRVVNP